MVVAIFALFSEIGAMVLLITPEGIKLELKLLKSGIVGFTQMMLGIRQRGRNAANLISDCGSHFCPFWGNLYVCPSVRLSVPPSPPGASQRLAEAAKGLALGSQGLPQGSQGLDQASQKGQKWPPPSLIRFAAFLPL